MFKIIFLFIFVIAIGLAAPALAQGIIKKQVPAVGELFKVKLKGNSTYIVDPSPNTDSPLVKIAKGSCENIVHDGYEKKNRAYLEYYTTVITKTPQTCTLKLRVIETNGAKTMTFVGVKKKLELTLTRAWQEVTLGKGHWAVLRMDEHSNYVAEMKAQIDLSRIQSCVSADDGETAGIGETILNKSGDEKYGITNRTSWYRIVRKECTLWLRALRDGNGTLTLLKLSGKPETLE